MPSDTDRFVVTIKLDIQKFNEDGSLRPFSATTQEYSGLDYVQLQEFQNTAFNAFVPALLAAGNEQAEILKGKADEKDKQNTKPVNRYK